MIEYRTLHSVDELIAVRALDNRIWGMEPTPLDQTLTVAKNGGLIIGAFESDQMVAFSYGFPGYKAGQVYLCSHKLGVLKGFRDRNIGYHLKHRQAEMARALGYRSIRWTYDPLESRNAYLNIFKLGAVCHEYVENCYGEMSGTLNADLPSDRFTVEWHLDATIERPQICEHLTDDVLQGGLLLSWRSRTPGLPEPVRVQAHRVRDDIDGDVRFRYVPIPADFQAVKRADIQLAREWRIAVREVFQAVFAVGWMVTGIAKHPSGGVQFYVLTKTD